MRGVQVGDAITTPGELESLPVGTTVQHEGGWPWQRSVDRAWYSQGHGRGASCTDLAALYRLGQARPALGFGVRALTVLYLPGRAPRPERAVQAQALRAWAQAIRDAHPEDVFIPPSRERLAEVAAWCRATGGTLDAVAAHVMRTAARAADLEADRLEDGDD